MNETGGVPDTVWTLCTFIHLWLQKKSSTPSWFLFSNMSDSWWGVWHVGHSWGVFMSCRFNKRTKRLKTIQIEQTPGQGFCFRTSLNLTRQSLPQIVLTPSAIFTTSRSPGQSVPQISQTNQETSFSLLNFEMQESLQNLWTSPPTVTDNLHWKKIITSVFPQNLKNFMRIWTRF